MPADELLYDPGSASFRANPYPTYARFRSEAPIVLSATGLRVVSRHVDVSMVLRSPYVSRDIDESVIDLAGDERARSDLRHSTRSAKSMLNLDPPDLALALA